ncbi:MAG: LysR family transcriptional regulator [Myxococcota bacterium]
MVDGLRDFDLNLLLHLQVLLRTRSVSAAAAELDLSQPTLSRSLQTLRDAFGDPLLVRSGRTMLATPRAQEIAASLDAVLRDVGGLVRPQQFDPNTAVRTFVLGASDLVCTQFLPALTTLLMHDAPGVSLSVRGDAAPLEGLLSGRLDVVAGSALDHAELQRTSLRVPSMAWRVLLGPKHECFDGELDEARWLDSSHVQLAPQGRYGAAGAMDRVLAERGKSRHIALELGHVATVVDVLLQTDWVCSLPEAIARSVAEGTRLRSVAHPLGEDCPMPKLCLTWHQRMHADPGHQWLRRCITGRSS